MPRTEAELASWHKCAGHFIDSPVADRRSDLYIATGSTPPYFRAQDNGRKAQRMHERTRNETKNRS